MGAMAMPVSMVAPGRPHFPKGGLPAPRTMTIAQPKSVYDVDEKGLVYSNTCSNWLRATVIAIHSGGSCEVQYEDGWVKQVPLSLQANHMKPSRHGNDYIVSDKVFVYSESRSCWLPATVNAIHRDKSCDIQYDDDGSMKQVPWSLQGKIMKLRSPL